MKTLVWAIGFMISNPLAYAIVAFMERFHQHFARIPPSTIAWYRRFYGLLDADAAIRRIHMRAMVNKLFYYLDLFGYAAVRPGTFERHLRFSNAEHLKRLIAADRPILFLQMHSGSFYSLLLWLEQHWKRINAVFVTQSRVRQLVHDAALSPHILNQMTAYGDIVAGLRRGESCLIMFDGGKFNPKNAERLTVNGCSLYFPTSSIAIARETGCNVLPVFSERRSWSETVFHFGPPIEVRPDTSMREVFDWYLPHLQADPTQWFALIANLEAGMRLSSTPPDATTSGGETGSFRQ